MNNHQLGRAGSQADTNTQPAQAAENLPQEDMMATLLRESDYAFRQLRRGETVEGTVVRVDPDEVLVDIGLKSEGIIPARELVPESEEDAPLEIGDKVLVYVLQPESQEGHAILSLRRARMERSWREIEQLYHQGTIIEAPVVDFNKGGLIADVKGVRGFIPVSQILDLRNITRQEGENEEVSQTLATMKGRRLPLKIIEINRSRNRLILSERSAAQERRTQRKDELLEGLAPGQIRRGVVSNITTFGAFVDLGGADGLVHVSELSYNRVNHPSEILHVGQEVDVSVLTVDRDTKKIALSLKKALPDPWLTVEERYHVGQVVPAVITKLAKFGAFAKVEEGLEGLIHTSEVTDLPVQDPADVVKEGQHVDVKIIHINTPRRRLGLSIRQAQGSQGQMESFGEVDEHLPFAEGALAGYGDEELPVADSYTDTIAAAPAIESAPASAQDEESMGAMAGTHADESQPGSSSAATPVMVADDPEIADPVASDAEAEPVDDSSPVATSTDASTVEASASETEAGLPAGAGAAAPTSEETALSDSQIEPNGDSGATDGTGPEPAVAESHTETNADSNGTPTNTEEAPAPVLESPAAASDDDHPEVASATPQSTVAE